MGRLSGPCLLLLLMLVILFLTFPKGGGRVAGGDGKNAGPSEVAGVLTLLSPHWEGIRQETERAFNEDRIERGLLPVQFDWLDVGGTSDIIRYIRSSFSSKPHGIGVDLIFGGGMDPYIALKTEGLLQKCELEPEILNALEPFVAGVPVYDQDLCWYGTGLSGFGILYNKVLLKHLGLPEPKSWLDLAAPEAYSQVCSADPRKSGSIFQMYEVMVQAYGWTNGMKVVSAVAGNTRCYNSASSTIVKEVVSGETAYGLAIDVHGYTAMHEVGEDLIGFVLPGGETVITPDAIAILKGAPRADLARDFIAFNLTERGQKIWSMLPGTFEGAPKEYPILKMPVRGDMYEKYPGGATMKNNPFKAKCKFNYNLKEAQGRFNIFRDYLGILFVDQSRDCARAWKKVMGLPDDSPLKRQFYNHPLQGCGQILELGGSDYKDTAKRAQIQADWANDARSRYHGIISETHNNGQ